MSATAQLRCAIAGLIGFAATEEEVLLAGAGHDVAESESARRWAAAPTVAHNTEFKAQQACAPRPVRSGHARPRGRSPKPSG